MNEKALEKARSQWRPRDGSGKTKFNRNKKKGQSWTALREEDRNRKKQHGRPVSGVEDQEAA